VLCVGEAVIGDQISFTPRANRALEEAQRESLNLGAIDIGTEHILLGLVTESECVAVRILRQHAADPENVRAATMRLVAE
jgi:ATP-dependent Clp protease ATP-binding subunit ClpC